MLGNFQPHAVEYLRFLPEILLTIFGILIFMLEARSPRGNKRILGALGLIGIALAFVGNCWAAYNGGSAFQNMIANDDYGTFFRGLVLVVGFLCILSSFSYLEREGAQTGEYYSLILFSLVGQCILATATDLIMVFIGLEISSIATYILAGFLRDDRRNNESALKYFLLGSFATAFLLYGISWIYGLLGSTNLAAIRLTLDGTQHISILVGLAVALLFVGFGFKVSVAPFQIWAPDVYQGAAAPVSAFMSAGPKAAAFAVFFRVFMVVVPAFKRALDTASVGLRVADHDHRELWSIAANQRETHAGIQLHRARRIHHDRAGLWVANWYDSRDVLSCLVCINEHRCVCRHQSRCCAE